ncbi:MAG: hypothetical protein JNM89_12325 [Hyphomicrobiaceae bacterium]|nr:hypothetical protein [Hyphomicrobiaceae bacterium]
MQATDASMKIARLSTEAARNYASAAFAAYADFTAQGMNMWAQAFDAMLPKKEPEPRSWYRPPAPEGKASRSAPANPFLAFAAFGWPQRPTEIGFDPMGSARGTAALPGSPFQAWQAWMRMWPVQGNPACWPMAFMLMQAGWPRDVAYPTAMGNVAMLEAVGTATELANQTYASYHSDGGYASSHVRYSRS